jgi:hypothetical protein
MNEEKNIIQFLKNRVLSDEKRINQLLSRIDLLEQTVHSLESQLLKTGTDVSLEAQIEAFKLIEKKDLDGLWYLLTEHFAPNAWMSEEQIKTLQEF